MKCSVCNHDTWDESIQGCTTCGITRMAIILGPGVMRRWSKRFRYLNPKKLKKRRKHGRSKPAPARLVMHRSRLKGSEAALLARRQAETLRTGQPLPETGKRLSARQDDVGRE